jgi:hypothetical protein
MGRAMSLGAIGFSQDISRFFKKLWRALEGFLSGVTQRLVVAM